MATPETEPPEIAVVIPTYMRAGMVAPLLDALAAQSLPPDRFEVVIVDDCSPDNTFALLEGLVGQYPYRLRVLRTEKNAGAAATRNVGWRATTAPVVAFLDDDVTPAASW